ncbi:MAG: prepilin-type N-terminal cleavage/methylation domain-containing protein [Planctomycetota bacterium]|jgi:prepilin-type N-terminal cleavage/methylation domain-containing protein
MKRAFRPAASLVSKRAGFTLIEMIAVLLILTVLVGIFVSQIGGAQELVESKIARAQLEQIAVAAAEYEVEEGDYPASHFDQNMGAAPNAINLGIERLVLALWSDGFDGCGLSPDDLDNLDGDRSAKALSDLPTSDLFEMVDPWGNPIAYFHHTDYEREDLYQTFDALTGERVDGKVRALRNSKTKLFFEHRRFQLISAGPDGLFATEDDIANFNR